MAKKQTRRSISVSRTTYERLKAYCETHGISMSQFVETRVGDFLGRQSVPSPQVEAAIQTSVEHQPETETVREEIEKSPPAKLTADQIFTF